MPFGGTTDKKCVRCRHPRSMHSRIGCVHTACKCPVAYMDKEKFNIPNK